MTTPQEKRPRITLDTLLLGASLADVKDDVYRNTLAIAALMEALEGRGLVSRQDVKAAMDRLDREAEEAIASSTDATITPPASSDRSAEAPTSRSGRS